MEENLKVVDIEVSLKLGNVSGVEVSFDIKKNFLKYYGVSDEDINNIQESVKKLAKDFNAGLENDIHEFKKNPVANIEKMMKEIISTMGGKHED
ncbi:hypothetical protein [Anaerorhabdus sp.]|uniref:hypothetical protein n=1 Tax=Anaerorhabdus sp. TaxID=1872524 RepID=UPI002FCBC064